MDVAAAPVSFAQQGLWYQAELEPGNPAYHVPVALSLRGAVDREALVKALEAIVARHEILRTTFALHGSELLQIIHARGRVPFHDEFIGGNGQLRSKIREEIHRPFDLTRGPLLRSVLFQRTPDESVLLLTMHHLVTDGWSLGVMVKELAAYYRHFNTPAVAGRPAAFDALPELEIQYADFAQWQREQASRAWAGQLAYWKDRLRTPLARPELPTDFPAPPAHTFEGATESFRMSAAALEALHEISRLHGATLFMTLLAAWKVLMVRHTSIADVVVGSPVAGRNRAAIEDLVGFFVNTQVLRTDLSGNPTFAEVIGRVRETTLGAWENQDVPFELLMSELQPERRNGANPFFQVMFALQNAPRGALELPGVHVEPLDVVTDTAKLPLTVINEVVGGELEVRMEYSTALFTRETIRRLGRRYERLLQAACENPAATIDRMPMLPDEERALLATWAGGAVRFEENDPLHGLFERQVERTPEAIAVRLGSGGGEELTYRELDERANRLANHLRSMGVGRETLVGLCLDRSIDLVVAILAILKAGGAYVPLDPSYPASRLQFIIEDSRAPVVVTHSAYEGLLDDARMVLIDRHAEAIAARNPEAPAIDSRAGDAAYVIYTSGSTGKPKGVVVTHANVSRLMAATEALFGFRESDVWTLFHSYAFDFSVWEIWGALLYGGRLIVVPYATSRTPGAFHKLLADERVTILNQTPSAFYQLMPFGAPPSLRTVIFGGEALDFQRLRAWFDRHGDERPQLVNMYGITETTVHVTHRVVRKADLGPPAGSVIGRALPDLAVHVLDGNGELAPIGISGEMYVGGAGVARGYLGRDELTAARFLDHPWGRLYRTGDSARWLPSGELEYLGRIDTQVKIRGFRIELGEIEHVLRGVPGIGDAVVVARPGPSDERRLVAYCVASAETTPNALRIACEEQLPDYMVPTAYVIVDSFPLNANGKLDRDALPDPDLDRDVARETYVAPANEIESTLARIWAEVLGLERAGTTDNFFSLGGDSILLLQVAAKSAKAGLKLTRRNLIEFQTIQELATVVRMAPPRRPAEAAAKPDQGAHAEIEETYALTPLQQGLLFHSQFAPQQDFYIEQLHAEVIGELNAGAFERAWREVIARHAVLRTSFVFDGEPRQRIHRQVPFAIEIEDWRAVGAEPQAERLRARLAADRARPFDLASAPLMRVALFRLADDRWHWLWTHHHLILDGWSLTAVAGEVLQSYAAFRSGSEPRLAQRRPFRDYIDWLGKQDAEAAESFWREALAGLEEPVSLQAMQSTSGTNAGHGEIEIALTEEETVRLQKWARQQQITFSTIVSAAWAKLLQTWGGTDDVVFGVTVAGRPAELAGYDQMVGPFINTLPLRIRIDADAPLESWMREVQKQLQRVREFETSRLVDIQRWSPLPAGRNLFETMVVFENYPIDESLRDQASGLSFGPVTFVERGHYALALAAIPGDRLALRLYFDGERFGAVAMQKVLEQLRDLLRNAESGRIDRVAQWSLLNDAERAALDVREPLRVDERSPHELFEEQAAKWPDRTALVFAGREMTYGELDARANDLARALRERGVGPDVVVGIRMQRSFEMIVAVLGIWKAGGAYLPLDPAYPDRRLEHMIRDSGAAFVLTAEDVASSHSSHLSHSSHSCRALAYVIYTSGSTGLPKGTLVERRGLTNLAHALAEAFTIDEGSRILQFASLSFDVSASEIVMALCFGASLHLATREEVLPGPALAELLRQGRITHLSIVPSALAAIPPVELPDLRCLVIGGEPCPPDLLAQWSNGRQLFNCYGPTEATVCTTYGAYKGGKLTIGKPIANAQTYVLDRHGAPVPAGAPGELFIGGAGVARGYVGRPDLSAERFVRDPFSSSEAARLYRTGDLVRELSDGNLEFLGRIDDQVKIRGFRIEPEEIAQVLRERGGLKDAAVVVRSGRIVAYCVAGGEVVPRELRDICAEWLPEHMVPSAYVAVGALPRTASGKLDRAALPDPDLESDIVRDAFVAATNGVEAALVKAWSEVLGVPRVGITDNFFALGGDSILTLQIVAKARRSGLQITPRQLFERPTIAELAVVASAIGMPAERHDRLASHPLTPIQRWFFEQDFVHPHRWNQAVLVEVAPSVSAAQLEEAMGRLAQDHDAFRSRFENARQRFASEGVLPFERVALPADIEQHANRLQSSLDLANGPLARAVHFTGEGKSLLLVVMHHLIVDGVSWRILLDDLSRLCRGETLEPALPFGAWAQRLEAASATAGSSIDYWTGLDTGRFRHLPVDTPGGSNRAGSLDIVESRLDSAETDALLRSVPAAYRTRINDVLLAAFGEAMRRWTGHDSVWVNLEGHGRESPIDDVDLSRTVGWFTSLFPAFLRVDALEPGTLLQSIAGQLRTIPDNGLGFGIARYVLRDPRLAALPQPEISFNYLGQFDPSEAATEIFHLLDGPLGEGQHPEERRIHLVDVVASVQSGQLRVAWHYSRDLYRRETIERAASAFVSSLRRIINHCLRLAGPAIEIEDAYTLSPMQQGLLFHALHGGDSALYVEQLQCELVGKLDADAFERAWREVIARHAVFRTSFAWEGLQEPIQRVQREVSFRVDLHDWRAAGDQQERVAKYLAGDRSRGLPLESAPLFRVALLRLGDERWHFVWTHHHILLDGWCTNLVVREVLDAYEALVGDAAPQPKRPRPYRDYIDWLGRQDAEAARKYWTRALAGFTSPTRLQLVERTGGEDGGEVELTLSALETRRLQSWTRRNHITLNTLVAGAWARLLQTISASKDVVFGVTVAGRPASLAGSEAMIGLFINTLPLRVGSAEGVPLNEWLQQVQSRQTELRDFEFSRLIDVQRCSDVPAGEPLFDTLLAFDNYPVDRSLGQRFGELEIRGARLAERTHYPLAISVVPADELRIRALYDGGRFEGATIRNLLGCLRELLLSAASGETHTAGDWRMVSPAERERILAQAGAEAAPVDDECLGTWFRRVARVHPQNVAVTFGELALTYAELERRANQLAHRLRSHGVGPESLVGLCLERSADLVVGMLGILEAGGAYVPLDPSNPADRLRFIAEDSGIALVVAHASSYETASALGVRVISIDADPIASGGSESPASGATPGNAAYVIYTSGSTGRPKGCVVTHANVSRLMKQTEALYSFRDDDVWTLFHSAAFDFSVWEIWGALLYGGRLVIVPYAVTRSPEEFYELLARERVTVLNQTPSAFRQLMAVDETRRANLNLRFVIFGGEALQVQALRRWFEQHGDQRPLLVNMYGITETTVHVTWRPIRLADLGGGSRIGAPIPDLRLYVLDPYQQLVPDGVAGELHVAGAGVSRGYHGRPSLTAERMVPNPFGFGRLYRTGDLARRRTDDIEYLGRADDQVKVRGFRIEVGEIEAVLAQHPAVREAVVLLRAFDDGEKRLAAYAVLRGSVSIDDLRAFLADRVPDYMIPAAFAFLEAMPLTSNGKINRAALPAPSAATGSTYEAPRSETERALAEVWSEVLGVDRVGIRDNFFSLGGDSIRSIQILSKARARGFDYSFQELFANPTIAALAGVASSRTAVPTAGVAFALIGATDREMLPPDVVEAYPLTRLQQGMFFHSDFEPGATAYHDVMSYHLRAPYDRDALAAALGAMAERHPILRTSFDFTSFTEPLQLVHRTATIPFDEADLRGAAAADDSIREWVECERRRPFATELAPLLRVHVHRRTADSFQLSLSFHHAILDGWSVATLLSELFRAYVRIPLPDAPASSFCDFVALERQESASEEAAAFWRDSLRGAQTSPLPRLRAEPAPHTVGRQQIDIAETTSRAIREFADRAGVPIRSALLAAHVRALAHILNENDVVTGVVTNGRPEEAGGERILGLFLNTIPFRIQLDGGSWTDLVRQTLAAEQRISRWRRYPLAEIRKAAGGAPPFDTDFNFVHFHVLDEVTAHGGVESLGAEGFEETNFTLAVNFSWWGRPGRLAGALDYDASVMTAEQAQEYARVYAQILEAIARDPEERYESRALTAIVPDIDRVEIAPIALDQLIDQGNPSRAAVRGEDCALTYGELHARANELANALRRRGVGPDVLVGVALPPGVDRVVALLGVVKAGGAYLPLDPETPRRRLQAIVADSAIRHVVTRTGLIDVGVPHVVDLDCDDESDAAPDVSVAPDNLAYALYTSGSTGTPKGVLITHRALVNHMVWMQRAYPLFADDVVFQKTPFTFDASVWEFWAPLMAGATLVVAKPGGLQDAAYLVETIRAEGITILQVVPTLLEALLAERRFGDCGSLRRVFVGGEALSTDLVRRFHDGLPRAELVNLYGPTETAIDATSQPFERGDHQAAPIGRPVANVRAYVLNDRLQFVPAGTDGDLYLAGPALGRGYLGRAAMTASSFVADPHGDPGTRMYRTGDRARWLPGGVLDFRGRADQQVKIRGHRVELAEVEAALAGIEGVEQAASAVVDGRLVAYIVGDAEASALRERLQDLLPDWMVPSFFVPMERLPLTASGKIDRKALPRPEAASAAGHAAYVAPSTEAERALADAWQALLAVPRVGAHDDFFELGGDSILSLRIASRLRQEGWSISPKLILEHQTVARIAARMARSTAAEEEIGATGEVPLSPIQRAFFDLQLPNPHHWNQSVALDVPSDFSAAAFERALSAVAAHHEAFRLRFSRGEHGWHQNLVADPGHIPLDRTGDFERVQSSLDITRGPLMRAALSDGHLLLAAHHLIVDGVSWRILLEDLASSYASALRNEEIRLPRRTSSTRTWVRNLERRAASLDASRWLALASAGVTTLPAMSSDNTEAGARSVVTRLDAGETSQLVDDLPRTLHARLPELFLTALAEAVTDWTGDAVLSIDVEGHGREELFEGVDVSRTAGWFTSVFPLAIERPALLSGAGLLEAVKEQWRAVPSNGIDFGLLRYLSPDARLRETLAALPPRPISFNYLGRFQAAADGPFRPSAVSGGRDRDATAPRQYLLDFNARVVGGQLSVEWTYAGGAFEREAIEALASSFLASLRRLAESDSSATIPSDFPLARLDAGALDTIAPERSGIEDILPLSPLQEGLLFHSMDDEQPGVYLQQITAVLEGTPDPNAFERAWNRTIERHSVLRTSFARRDLQRPLQIVHRQAHVAPAWLDWRELKDEQRRSAWDELLRHDRAAGIDLDLAPLMRLTVVRESESRWRLLWTHHHAILDGWSLPIVMRDVAAFYRQETEGVPAVVEEAPRYAKFIEWIETRDRAAAEEFWRGALEGFDRPSEIALPRPAAPAAAGFDHVELVLANDLTARLNGFAQSSHVTLNTLLQAMWTLLLRTYSREDDVVFGVTVSGRPADLAGIDRTAGLFINTLPLRMAVRPGQPVGEFLREIQRRQAELSLVEFTPLVDVQRWSEVQAGQALFETIFVFENYPLGESLEQSPLRDFSMRDAQSVEWTHYPLACFVTPSRELRLRLVYDTARFERKAIERMVERAARILETILDRRDASVGAIAAEERNAPHIEGERRPMGRFVHERIAAQAALTPEACAITFEEQTVSYRELDERSSRLASHLRAQGLGPESVAGIFLDRSPEMIVALLGVLKAGAAYLPLDPRFPLERLAMMVEDAAPRVILTQKHLVGRDSHVLNGAPNVVIIDGDWPAIDREEAQAPDAGLTPENLAYVIFTSGSTGRPKGVQIPHRALSNLVESFERRPGMTAGDVMVAVTTLSFDIAALELFLPLMTGARLVIASAEDAADPDRLSALLDRHRATVMQATPATWRMLLSGGWKPPASLRIWCGGEAMPGDLADELRANGSELWNVYGPTETTIWSAIHPVSGASDSRVFGLPVANTTLSVVDANLDPSPPGVPGELLIGGEGVARGYRGQAAMTAERFVPDPFSGTPGARAYRTGDQVRLRDDGTIEFLGRDDNQVKIRGFRVELGEIEAAARRVDGVRDAVVVFGDGRLVGYVVRNGRGDLAAAMRRTLPDYMVPGLWVDLDALPLTPNGKIDRNALPKPGIRGEDDSFVRPRTAIEEVLAEVWQETLGIERVGIRDSFFALGGHSLHAAQIVAWLRRAFSTKIPLRILFEANTVEKLAAALSGDQPQAQKTAGVLLRIRRMSPEEKARRLQQRQTRREDATR